MFALISLMKFTELFLPIEERSTLQIAARLSRNLALSSRSKKHKITMIKIEAVRVRKKTSQFLQHGVKDLLKTDNRVSDFGDSKLIVQIIGKEKQKQLSAGYLTRLWKNICNSIQACHTRALYSMEQLDINTISLLIEINK